MVSVLMLAAVLTNMFKLQVGSICKLNEIIPGLHKKDDWKTGLYRVKSVRSFMVSRCDANKPQMQSYSFEKIKKDGTVYKNFINGYNCLAWDKFIDDGKVTIINPNRRIDNAQIRK